MRGPLAPAGVPITRSPAQVFDDLVLDAVEQLEPRWGPELEKMDFAVEIVPELRGSSISAQGGESGTSVRGEEDGPDSVLDDHGVPLARIIPAGESPTGQPTIVLYRRPLESRSFDEEDLGDLVFEVVVDRIATLLGRDPDEIDPPPTGD
jgi:hypothetical protein